MIWLSSDMHFNHKNILNFGEESREGFSSIDEMNEKIIENWNSVVADEDTVYMLGDIFFGNKDSIDEIMPRLKGKKILIRGNHDSKQKIDKMKPYLEGDVYDIFNLKYKKRLFVLCHYPMREWLWKEQGSIHCYGHVHSNEHRNGILQERNSFHVGMDTNDLKPVSIDSILRSFYPCGHKDIKKEGNKKVYCVDCGKIVEKNIINNKEVWI